jgi:glycosyltransferase involved in cell wall biosynthesis
MRIVYAAFRHDPRDPDAASGADFNFYSALRRNGFDVRLVGPFTDIPLLPERVIKKLYKLFPERRYPKYSVTNTWRASHTLNRIDQEWNPDVIFTLYPATLAMYKGNTPCVFRTDTTFLGMHKQGPEFLQHGSLALAFCVWEERRALRHCARIVTHSDWSKQVLMNDYHVDEDRILVIPNPAALPNQVVPDNLDVKTIKYLEEPLRLLLVGRDYHRKGVDIAIAITEKLNNSGMHAELTVCATSGPSAPNVKFVGPYKKTDPEELREYVKLYERAHLLLHPARFDASPIVTAEAAAFGTPTLTNNSGGLATSVKHNESGLVLPRGSSPDAYVGVIQDLIQNPKHYYELCLKTRRRYQLELNWDVAGKRVGNIVEEVARGTIST